MSATAFIILAVCAVVIIACMSAIMKKAREYNMRVLFSKQYALLLTGVLVGAISGNAIESQQDGIYVCFGIIALTFSYVAFINIKKSNPAFGIIFTAFQTLMLPLFFVSFLAIFGKLNKQI